jgi:TIR domain-containing protein
MAPKIFLAHAREDKAQVRTLYADLKARGFDPWLDEIDLLPGEIEFRLALSAFGDRPHGSIFLIPVRFEDCEVPDLQIPDRGLSLRDIHWVDLWEEEGFDKLVRSIEKALKLPDKAPGLRMPAEATHRGDQ